MKRIVSLVLVLVLLLSVLPGAAAETAELTMTCPTKAPLPGGMGFHFELDGELVEDSRVTDVQLVGDGLGTVFYEEDRARFTWDTNQAYPGRSGKLQAVVDGVTYEIDVSTEDTPMVAFYRGTECTEENYLLNGVNHRFLYGSDNTPVITVKVNEPEWTIGAGSYDRAGIMNVDISEDGKTATYTLKEDVTGSWETRLLPIIDGQEWVLRTIIVAPEGVTASLTNNSLPGGRQFDILVDGEVVAPSRITDIHLSDETLGFILRVQDEINNGANFDLNDGQFLWDTNRAYPNRSGAMYVTMDGQEYEIPVSTGAPRWGFYTDESCSADSYLMRSQSHRLSYTQESGLTVWFKLNDGETVAETNTSNNQIMTAAALPETPSNMTSFTLNEGVSGTHEVQLTVMTNMGVNRNIWITVSDETFTDTDAFPLTEEWTRDWVNESNICATPFELDGETYYLSASFAGASFPTSINSMQPVINDEAEIHNVSFSIEFWTDMGDRNYQRITDPEHLEKIKTAFNGTLALECYGRKNWVLAEEYPAMTRSSNWRCPIELHLNLKNHGDWVFRASGTIGGKTIESICHYQWAPKGSVVWRPDVDAEVDVWTQVQNFITSYVPKQNVMQIVEIPAGTYTGTLVIDDKRIMDNAGLSIVGAPKETVIILGGIKTEGNQRIGVENLTFHGANCGCEDHEFPENAPNKAIYGNAVADVTACTFVGYDVAARIDHTVDCTFINNNVAILFDNYLLGNGQILYNRFVGNKTALDFEKLDPDLPTTFFSIRENQFIDNKWDVRNKLKRTLYLPGNFFGETVGEDLVARPCNAQVKKGSVVASLMDETVEADNLEYAEQIHAYPRYADSDFNAWVKESEAVVSVAQTAEFRIPQANLSGTAITVMDAEEELATLVFPDSGSTVSLFSENADSFDATVFVEENDDGSMTFTMNDPLGMTPTVRIPCENWGDAEVTYGGQPVACTVEDGAICFAAAQGGSYTILPSVRVERVDAHTVSVQVGLRTVSRAVTAVYDKDGKLLAVSIQEEVSQPWIVSVQDYDLNRCEIKVMLLNDSDAPLCGAAFLKAAKSE